MKTQNQVFKKSWNEVRDRIKISNNSFYELISQIAEHLTDQKRYVYFFDLLYGTSIIKEGQPSIFDNESLKLNNGITIKEIKNDLVAVNTDFPLSIIIKNYVEIFRKNSYKHIDKFDYYVPIELIKENNLFGVWGAVESMLCDSKKELLRENWNGVTGRQCFVSLFEVRPIEGFNPFIKIFSDIFGKEFLLDYKNKDDVNEIRKRTTNTAKAIQYFISKNVPDSNVEFYSFPKHFYIIDDNDSIELKMLKHKLKDYLYSLAWKEKESRRELEMQGLLIKEMHEKERIDYDYSMNSIRLLKHFYGIFKGKTMYLKPVGSSDPIEFKAFLTIVDRMRDIDDAFSDFCPYFFYYDKKSDWSVRDSGIEFMALPAISDFFISNADFKKFKKDLWRDIFNEKGKKPKAGLNFFIENSCNIKLEYIDASDKKDVLEFLNQNFGKDNNSDWFNSLELIQENQYYFDRIFPKIFLSYIVCFKVTDQNNSFKI
jgi:hypothetical protein